MELILHDYKGELVRVPSHEFVDKLVVEPKMEKLYKGVLERKNGHYYLGVGVRSYSEIKESTIVFLNDLVGLEFKYRLSPNLKLGLPIVIAEEICKLYMQDCMAFELDRVPQVAHKYESLIQTFIEEVKALIEKVLDMVCFHKDTYFKLSGPERQNMYITHTFNENIKYTFTVHRLDSNFVLFSPSVINTLLSQLTKGKERIDKEWELNNNN